MATKDIYQTIRGESNGEFRDRGSKFIAYAYPVYTEEEWQEKLEAVRKAHPKARHHCYAYRLGLDGHNFRANDDGEPSGTAGRPILGQIDSFGLVNVIVIVVRYFGGTLLGASGLITAYKNSAADALSRRRPVLVHAHFGHNALDAAPLARRFGIPLVVTFHDLVVGKSLGELHLRRDYNVTVILVRQVVPEGTEVAPGGDFVVKDSDILVVLGRNEDLEKLRDL